MPDLQQFGINNVGGLNVDDQADELLSRNFQFGEGGYMQTAPAESPSLQNIDYDSQGFTKRKGSTEADDLTTLFTGGLSGDILVGGIEWQAPTTGVRIQILVSNLTIYTNQSGNWAQINDSAGAGYTHSAGVTKCSFAKADGHLFIGLDGANAIQTYKVGADLDPEMATGNTYEYAYGGSDTITGTWGDGYYMLATIHERLVFSDGNSVINYTPMAFTTSSGIWDFTNGGFKIGAGDIRALISFTPHLQNELNEQLYIGTTAGMEVITGFLDADNVFRIEGSEAPFNHQSFCNARNWVIYLTDEKNLMGINGARVIDLGRRAKNTAANGPLDKFNGTFNPDSVFGFYHQTKQQAEFYFTTEADDMNDTCIVLDFKLGEPLLQEAQNSFETRVRLLKWVMVDPSNNDWFVGKYQIQGSVIGISSAGKTYTTELGLNDYGTLAVLAFWFSPVFTAGPEFMGKQWMAFHFRGLIRGDYALYVGVFLDRANHDTPSANWQYNQSSDETVYGSDVYGTAQYSESQTTAGSPDIDLYSEAIQWKVFNSNADETFVITSQYLHYIPGTPIR